MGETTTAQAPWRDYRSAPEKGAHFRKGWMFKGDAGGRCESEREGEAWEAEEAV